jgi:hypothetical protein
MVIYPSDRIEFSLTDFSEFKELAKEFSDDNVSYEKKELWREGKDQNSFERIGYGESGEIQFKLPNGKDIKTLLYIPIQMFPEKYFNVSSIMRENLNRYHLFKCNTVMEMEKRAVPFRLTVRDSGKFDYSFVNHQKEHLHHNGEQELFVCKSCLEQFNTLHQSNLTKEQFIPSYHLNQS